MSYALFISLDELKKDSMISGNIDPSKLLPSIKAVQQIEVHPVLGTDLYNKLSNDIIAQSVTGDYLTLKNSYIHPFLVHKAVSYYLPYSAYIITNGGISKWDGGESRTGLTVNELNFMVNKEEQIAEMYKQRLIDYLCANSVLFPEYTSNTDLDDIKPSKNTNLTNWYLN